MSIPTYLPLTTIAGCVATIVAVVYGVNRALGESNQRSTERAPTLTATALLLVGWFAVAVTLAILGVYSATSNRIPTIQFGIAVPILIGGWMIWRWPAVSRMIDAVPRRWVIAIQFFRVEGMTFLALFSAHLLPGSFALPAGVGDVAVGLLAAAIASGAIGGRPLNPKTVLRWNLLGIADLVVAVSTGFLTAPSPFQKFAFDRPSGLISMFPLVLIPTFLAPLAVLLHIISLVQLRRAAAPPAISASAALVS